MTTESWKAQHWLKTVQKTDLSLPLSWQEALSYRNQSTDLQSNQNGYNMMWH